MSGPTGQLTCRVVELKFTKSKSFMEPYVIIKCGSSTHKTAVYKGSDKNLRAYWNESFTFSANGQPMSFNFQIFDENVLKDELIAVLNVTLSSQPNGQTQPYRLINGKSKHVADLFLCFTNPGVQQTTQGYYGTTAISGAGVTTQTNAGYQNQVNLYNPNANVGYVPQQQQQQQQHIPMNGQIYTPAPPSMYGGYPQPQYAQQPPYGQPQQQYNQYQQPQPQYAQPQQQYGQHPPQQQQQQQPYVQHPPQGQYGQAPPHQQQPHQQPGQYPSPHGQYPSPQQQYGQPQQPNSSYSYPQPSQQQQQSISAYAPSPQPSAPNTYSAYPAPAAQGNSAYPAPAAQSNNSNAYPQPNANNNAYPQPNANNNAYPQPNASAYPTPPGQTNNNAYPQPTAQANTNPYSNPVTY